MLTLSLPSRPQLTTVRFRLSIIKPVTDLVCFELSGRGELDADSVAKCVFMVRGFGARGGKLCRWRPDCRLNISMEPPEDPMTAKVPHGETATLYDRLSQPSCPDNLEVRSEIQTLTSVPSLVGNAHRPARFFPQNHVRAYLSPR